MSYTANYYTLDAKFSYTLGDDDDIVVFLDDVVQHLEDLGVDDVIVALDSADQVFTVSQLIGSTTGESVETVVGKGLGALRTAFHACNGGTNGWPTIKEAFLGVNVEPATLLVDEQDAAREQVAVPA